MKAMSTDTVIKLLCAYDTAGLSTDKIQVRLVGTAAIYSIVGMRRDGDTITLEIVNQAAAPAAIDPADDFDLSPPNPGATT